MSYSKSWSINKKIGANGMFEMALSYSNMFEKQVYDTYYNKIGTRTRKRKKRMICILTLLTAALVIDYFRTRNSISYSSLTIILQDICIVVAAVSLYIVVFAWHSFYLKFNKILYLDRFKDNDPIDVKISSDEAYITYHSEKIILLPKYPLFQINKNKHFRVFVYDTQKYIFFTMTNSYYFIYIDKEQFSADTIKELQENLQNIYGKCYVKKY